MVSAQAMQKAVISSARAATVIRRTSIEPPSGRACPVLDTGVCR